MIKKLKYIIPISVSLVLLFVWLFYDSDESDQGPAYSISKVSKGRIKSTVSATGSVNPVITVEVGSQVSGTIKELKADFNSEVKKDQVIAIIDPAIFKARLAEAEANLKSAIAEQEKAKVKLRDTKRKLNRQQKLHKRKLVSDSDLETARFNYDAAAVEVQVAVASVDRSIAIRDREKVNLDYTTIFAPIDGVVISRDVDVGQTVAASLQAPTLFTIAQSLTQMLIETDVDEAFIGKIQQGQTAEFTVFAYSKRVFKGRVTQIRLKPKVESGVVKYNCIVQVDNADLALKPGMTATVNIVVANKRNILRVPNAALRYVPDDWPQKELRRLRRTLKPNQAFIWKESGDKLEPVKVSVGVTGERYTEISGDDLQQDMPVLIPPKRTKAARKRKFGLKVF